MLSHRHVSAEMILPIFLTPMRLTATTGKVSIGVSLDKLNQLSNFGS